MLKEQKLLCSFFRRLIRWVSLPWQAALSQTDWEEDGVLLSRVTEQPLFAARNETWSASMWRRDGEMRAEEAAGRESRPRLGKQERCLLGVGSWGESYLINHFSFPSMWQSPQRGDWYHSVSLVWFNNPNDCRGDTIVNRAEKSPALNLTENQRGREEIFQVCWLYTFIIGIKTPSTACLVSFFWLNGGPDLIYSGKYVQ